MRPLGFFGAEAGDLVVDGVFIDVGGFFVGYSGSFPPGSGSVSSITFRGDTLHVPFHEGSTATGTPRTPAGTLWGFQFQMNIPTQNTNIRCGVSNGAVELLSLTKNASGFVELRIAGAAVAAAAVYTWPLTTWRRFTVDVDDQIGGYVRVYVDGDTTIPIIDYTLPGALPALPNAFWMQGDNIGGILVDDMIAWEYGVGSLADDLNLWIDKHVGVSVPNANGTYTAWTGDYTDIDEIPNNDADYIEATAVDTISTFAHTGTTEDLVVAVQVKARVIRSGLDAGQRIHARQRVSATDSDHPTVATGAPGDGAVIIPMDVDATGADWTAATFNASEFGVVSRT